MRKCRANRSSSEGARISHALERFDIGRQKRGILRIIAAAVAFAGLVAVLGVSTASATPSRASEFSAPDGWEIVPNSIPFQSKVRTWRSGHQVLQLTIDKTQTTLEPYPSDVLNQLKRGFGIGYVTVKSVRRGTTCGKRPVWLVAYDDIGPNHPLDSRHVIVLYGNWGGHGYSLAYAHPFFAKDLPAAIATFNQVCV